MAAVNYRNSCVYLNSPEGHSLQVMLILSKDPENMGEMGV